MTDIHRGGLLEWGGRWLPGIELSPMQLEIVRVIGGEDPQGGPWNYYGHIDDVCRRVVGVRAGRRGFKTTLAAWISLHAAMTCDLSQAGGGADVVVPIVAPSQPQTKLALNMAIHMATNGGLRDCINTKQHDEARKRQAVTSTSLHLLRPHDGRSVEIRSVVASPGGRNLVGFHIPALVIDEAERMRNDSEANITDAEQLDAAMPALLPQGTAILISTPYDLESYMHKHIERNYGHPVDGMACVATTRQLRPDSQMILDMVARELQRNPAIAMRDYECVPLGRLDSYFEAMTVKACTLENTLSTLSRVSAGADLGFIRDGSALAIVERQGDRVVQVHEQFVTPTPTEPLKPSVIRSQYLSSLREHACNQCGADVHEWASLCEAFIPEGIQVTHAPTGQQVTTAFALVRDLMRAGKLSVLPETAKQMRLVRTDSKGGPDVPRKPGEGHADLVSAIVAAVWLDRRHGPVGGSGSGFAPGALRCGCTT